MKLETIWSILPILVTFSFADDQLADNELLNWTPPKEVQRGFAIYLSGHDNDGIPVWYMPLGLWKYRHLLDDPSMKDEALQYISKIVVTIASPELFSQPGNTATSFISIMNMDGFGLAQFTHVPTVQLYLGAARKAAEVFTRKHNVLHKIYYVNSNFVFQQLYTLFKPILGTLSSKIDVLGTNPKKWKPILLTHIPRTQLPEAVGGYKNHTFIKSFD